MTRNESDPSRHLRDSARLAAVRATGLLDGSPDESFQRLTRLAAEFLRVPVALVSLVDADRQVFPGCVGLPEPWADARETPLSHSFCQHALGSAEPLVVRDARAEPRFRDSPAIPDLGVVAYAGIPLVTADGEVLGSFCVIDHQPRDWTGEEIQILTDLADAATTALQYRLQLHEAEARRAQLDEQATELEAQADQLIAATVAADAARDVAEQGRRLATFGAEIGVAVTRGGELQDILRRCTEVTVEHLDAAFARIWTLNEAEQVLELQASAGMYTHLDGPHGRVPVGKFKIGLIAEEREPHLTNDVQHDPRVSDKEWARRVGVVSFAGYPLIIADRLVGVMALFARRPLSDDALLVLRTAADAVSMVIRRARDEEEQARLLREVEVERARLQSVFAQAPAAIAVTEGPEHVYVIANARYARLADERPLLGKRYKDAHPEVVEQGFLDLLDRVYATGEPYVANEARVLLARQDGGAPEEHFLDFVYQPLRGADGRVSGILTHIVEVTEQVRARQQVEAARREAEALSAQLQEQAMELEQQVETSQALNEELEASNQELLATTEALQESIRRARFLAEAMPQKVWTADANGNVDYFNRHWLDYTGLSFEELRDWGWKQIIHPDDWEANQRVWQHSIDTGIDFQLEHRFRRSDGTYRWHLSRGLPRRDGEGHITMWVGTNTDIDEQKRNEEEVRTSEARYRMVTRATNDVIWDWNLATDELLWNEALETTFGYPPARVPRVIQFWYDHVHPEDRDRVVHGIHAVIDGGGEAWSDEYRFLRTDGSYAEVLDRGVVSRDAAGRPVRMIGSMQDVTERKRAEAEREQLLALARTERQRLEQIFTVAPAVMAIYTGPEHVVTLVNPTWEQSVGKPGAVGKPFCDVFPEFRESGLFELLDRVYETGEPYSNPEVIVPLERWGSGMPEETSWHLVWLPLPAREGQTERDILVHAVEVTEQVRARRQIDAARAEAEEANRSKSQFLANMSHELRTPLNAIGGYVELIEMGIRGPVTDEQRADLQRVRRAQQHLLGLINDVLNFAKLEAGRVEFDIADVPVEETLAAVEVLIAPQAEAREIAYHRRAGDPEVVVRADRDKLQQIVLNLLSNAVKFTDMGGEIQVRWETGEGAVDIHVRDTGHGIPFDKLATVFEPFVQVDPDLTRAGQGTGLGLAISRDLARGMGGDLFAESTPGEGSTFTLRLPTP